MRTTSGFDEKKGELITVPLPAPRLSPDAYPTKLPNCPAYLSTPTTSRPSRDDRQNLIEQRDLHAALRASEEEYIQKENEDRITNLQDIRDKFTATRESSEWTVKCVTNQMQICKLMTDDSVGPWIAHGITINNELCLNAYSKGVSLPKIGRFSFPYVVTRLSEIMEISELLNQLGSSRDDETDSYISVLQLVLFLLTPLTESTFRFKNVISLIVEQLKVILCQGRISYSPQFLVFSSLFYSISPGAYRFMRNSQNLILPSMSTIRRITLMQTLSPAVEQQDENFLHYIKRKVPFLGSAEKFVSLLIDEIHLKPYFDYKGGNVVGTDARTLAPATSAYAFMLSGVFSKFKDVAHILPASKMTGEILFTYVRMIILELEKIGFTVIAVITDNNSINKKTMSQFSDPPCLRTAYQHPSDASRPLFFLFDSVHILKCVRNNWLNQKDSQKTMKFPAFNFGEIDTGNAKIHSACFRSLRNLFNIEHDSIIKFSHKLSKKALMPSSLERQNVQYALQVFSNYVAQALISLGPEHRISNYKSTSDYLKIFITWWDIVNVKSPLKGQRLNNEFEKPVTKDPNDQRKLFLLYFVEWLESWDTYGAGKLTMETYTAILQTSRGLLQVAEYLLKEYNYNYILLGKFQTDNLEARFGQYRQLSGGQYHVSIRQVFECEKKIRLLTALKLDLNSETVTISDFSLDWAEFQENSLLIARDWKVSVSDDDLEKSIQYLPVITYLAGYCSFSVNRKLNCRCCEMVMVNANGDVNNFQNEYITGVSRGGLLYPNECVVLIVRFVHIIVDKLCKIPEFLVSTFQRRIATELAYSHVSDDESFALHETETCSNGHSDEKLCKLIIWPAVNAFLNNYCRNANDEIVVNKQCKKRKLATLQK